MDLFVPILAVVGFVIVPFFAIGIALVADLAVETVWHRFGDRLHRATHAALHHHS